LSSSNLDALEWSYGDMHKLWNSLTVLTAGMVLATSGCASDSGSPTQSAPSGEAVIVDGTRGPSKEAVLAEYVAGLQAGDRGRLKQLSKPHTDPDDAIDKKIDAIGNRRWSNVEITWPDTVTEIVSRGQHIRHRRNRRENR
jgi:hypothetical protein